LKGGSYAQKALTVAPTTHVLETHSADSFMVLNNNPMNPSQVWGTSGGGHENIKTIEEPPYTTVSMLAGTADSALLYDPATGFTDFGSLSGGVFQSLITSTLSSGWKIIVGGR
jgi:hypothetical protein